MSKLVTRVLTEVVKPKDEELRDKPWIIKKIIDSRAATRKVLALLFYATGKENSEYEVFAEIQVA